MHKIMVLGIGPGGEDYILPVVRNKVTQADVLVGGERALAPFATLEKQVLPVTADLTGLADAVRTLAKTKSVAVLLSGDPGFHSLLAYLRRHFLPEELEVVPGISSVQVAFSRLAQPWQDATLLSAHGRDGEDILPALLSKGNKAILTDRKWTPGRLAALILQRGGTDQTVALCRRLTTDKEEVVMTRLTLLDGTEEGDCVMVILDE